MIFYCWGLFSETSTSIFHAQFVLLRFSYSAGLPQSPHSWPISFLCLSPLNEIFALWGARWRRRVRAITCLSSSLPLSFSQPQSSSFFFFFLSILQYIVSVSHVFPSHSLSLDTSSFVSSICFQTPVSTWGRQCCSVPIGLIKVRSRSNALWHILIKKKKSWCSLLRSPANSGSNLHHITNPSRPLLEPGWPPAKINEHFLFFSSKR